MHYTVVMDEKVVQVYVGVLKQPGAQVFDSNGTFINKWGKSGKGPDQFSISRR
jgi:hypothetical protein